MIDLLFHYINSIMKTIYNKTILTLLILLTSVLGAFAQTTIVNGTVTDAKTKEPLPFVTVVFAGSTNGNSTDTHGKFHIATTGNYSGS